MTSDYSKLVYPDLSYRINGVLFSVHNELGRFRNENQYADRVEEKFKKVEKHFEKNKQDKRALNEKSRIFAQIRKIKQYNQIVQ